MTAVKEPPLADIGTEFGLAADRARQAVEAEKEAVRNAVEKYFNDLDGALVSFMSIARRVGGMPSMRQVGDDDEVAIGTVLKRLGRHARGDETQEKAA